LTSGSCDCCLSSPCADNRIRQTGLIAITEVQTRA